MAFDMGNTINTLADNLMGGGSVAGGGFMDLLTYVAYFSGVILAYSGLLKIHKRSEMSHQQSVPTNANVIITFVLAAALLSFGHTVDVFSSSLGMSSSLNYGSNGASGNAYINGGFRLLQFAGYAYLLRTLFYIYQRNSGSGHEQSNYKLITHLIGATMMIHATDSIKLLAGTLGIDISILGLT